MITQKKWIDIVEQKSTGKTRVFTVVSKEEDMLGWIKWFGRWRKYVFFPEKDTVYECDCLEDIASFLKELMDDRKKNKQVTEMKNLRDFDGFLNENSCGMVAPWWHYFNELVEGGSSREEAAELAAGRFPNAKSDFDELLEKIKKEGDDYVVYPKSGGKRLGTHRTKAGALKQLAAIEISKAKRGR